MQKSYAYISKWCVWKAGKTLKQVLMIIILNNRGSICLKEREQQLQWMIEMIKTEKEKKLDEFVEIYQEVGRWGHSYSVVEQLAGIVTHRPTLFHRL